jgi:hypothetical protein
MPIVAPKKKRSLMPLLTVVFLGSYGLMTLLIVEQNSAIQQQRNLIEVLLGDSTELWAMKGKILTDKAMRDQAQNHGKAPSLQTPSSQTPSPHVPSIQTPSTQIPSAQAPATKTPSTQVPQNRAQNRAGKAAKPQTQLPPMPASDLGDQRRALITL